ncbi:MAG TPA: hypothetical protein VK436_07095 [Methanocella sp.]|nr:hypothetical protein [Methanocella sp.]
MVPSYNFPIGTSRKDPAFSRIVRIINGFRGYDSLDDLKAADAQVRETLARLMSKTRTEMDQAIKLIDRGDHPAVLPEFHDMITHVNKAIYRLSRPTIQKITTCKVYTPMEDAVGKIYNLDFQMLSDAESISRLMREFQRIDHEEDSIRSNIIKITMAARDIPLCLDEKEELIACMIS